MKKGIILCSGGLDSVTTAYYVKKSLGYSELIVLFFNYGQRNLLAERRASKECALGVKGKFVEMEIKYLNEMSGSLINSTDMPNEIKSLKDTKEESDKYYVPCRNTLFLVNALALAESILIQEGKVYEIFVGFKHEGEEGYPDTSSDFVEEINKLSKLSCKGKFEIKAPLIEKDKEDIVRLSVELGVDLGKTFSCYIGPEKHCGICLACELRKKGFYWAGVEDVTEYSKA